MEIPLCQCCSDRRTEIVVLPGEDSSAQTEYLCEKCFCGVKGTSYQALPFNFVTVGYSGEMVGRDQDFANRAQDLIHSFYAYQAKVKSDVTAVRRQYENLFEELSKMLEEVTKNMLNLIEESETVEIEHIDATILDLKSAMATYTLMPSTARLASYFNTTVELPFPQFMSLPEDFEEPRRMLQSFPQPAINITPFKERDDEDDTAGPIVQIKRLIEDPRVIMPLDTINILISDFSRPTPAQNIVSCSEFRYRSQAKWCRVDENLYIYSGGLNYGTPVAWVDFLEISSDLLSIQVRRGKDMCLPRTSHAVICHEDSVYAIGGYLESSETVGALGVEVLRHYGEWERAMWQPACAMDSLFDPTVTILKNCAYIAGKGRALYKLDFGKLSVDKLQCYSPDAEEGKIKTSTQFPLPRKASNSLIFSWESQVFVLQHDFVFYFSPNSSTAELSKKSVGISKPWYSASPVVIWGSKGYFTLESPDVDTTQTVDVWCFDFVKKSISTVNFRSNNLRKNMTEPLCSGCTELPAEIVVMPGENPDVMVEYLCANCFRNVQSEHYQALPYSCVTQGPNGEPMGEIAKFESKASELISSFYYIQDKIKDDVGKAIKEYTQLFADLFEALTTMQTKVMTKIEESAALELEHINAFIGDLRAAKECSSLRPDLVYIASHFNAPDEATRLPFIVVPGNLAEYRAFVSSFPEPKIHLSNYDDVPQEPELIRKSTTLRTTRRLIEDEVILMPIDTLNVLISDFSKQVPERNMIPCPKFAYRAHARWCKVDEDLYIYGGGLYKGEPVAWCDFIDTSQIVGDRPFVSKTEGRDMTCPRHHHALISHERGVYAIGGTWAAEGEEQQDSGMEVMKQIGEWRESSWQSLNVTLPNMLDPTVTILKNVIYIAGKSRSVLKFDIISQKLDTVVASRVVDLQLKISLDGPVATREHDELIEGNAQPTDGRFLLQRQSSNSLVLAWEAQVIILQHDHLYSFSPSSEHVEVKKKRISAKKAWCCPFPAIISGSKAYFMLEATESDVSPAEDVWYFDFVKNDVGLVKFANR